jgi:hypothetical protein
VERTRISAVVTQKVQKKTVKRNKDKHLVEYQGFPKKRDWRWEELLKTQCSFNHISTMRYFF